MSASLFCIWFWNSSIELFNLASEFLLKVFEIRLIYTYKWQLAEWKEIHFESVDSSTVYLFLVKTKHKN